VYYRGEIDVTPFDDLGGKAESFVRSNGARSCTAVPCSTSTGHFDIHYRNRRRRRSLDPRGQAGRFEVHTSGSHLAGIPT